MLVTAKTNEAKLRMSFSNIACKHTVTYGTWFLLHDYPSMQFNSLNVDAIIYKHVLSS